MPETTQPNASDIDFINAFYCPISHDSFADIDSIVLSPATGNSYQKTAIQNSLKYRRVDPLSPNLALTVNDLIPNNRVKRTLLELQPLLIDTEPYPALQKFLSDYQKKIQDRIQELAKITNAMRSYLAKPLANRPSSLKKQLDEFNKKSQHIDWGPICPLSCQLLTEAYISQQGISYQRAAVEAWREKQLTEPVTGQNLIYGPLKYPEPFIKNRLLTDVLQSFQQHCPDACEKINQQFKRYGGAIQSLLAKYANLSQQLPIASEEKLTSSISESRESYLLMMGELTFVSLSLMALTCTLYDFYQIIASPTAVDSEDYLPLTASLIYSTYSLLVNTFFSPTPTGTKIPLHMPTWKQPKTTTISLPKPSVDLKNHQPQPSIAPQLLALKGFRHELSKAPRTPINTEISALLGGFINHLGKPGITLSQQGLSLLDLLMQSSLSHKQRLLASQLIIRHISDINLTLPTKKLNIFELAVAEYHDQEMVKLLQEHGARFTHAALPLHLALTSNNVPKIESTVAQIRKGRHKAGYFVPACTTWVLLDNPYYSGVFRAVGHQKLKEILNTSDDSALQALLPLCTTSASTALQMVHDVLYSFPREVVLHAQFISVLPDILKRPLLVQNLFKNYIRHAFESYRSGLRGILTQINDMVVALESLPAEDKPILNQDHRYFIDTIANFFIKNHKVPYVDTLIHPYVQMRIAIEPKQIQFYLRNFKQNAIQFLLRILRLMNPSLPPITLYLYDIDERNSQPNLPSALRDYLQTALDYSMPDIVDFLAPSLKNQCLPPIAKGSEQPLHSYRCPLTLPQNWHDYAQPTVCQPQIVTADFPPRDFRLLPLSTQPMVART